MSAEPTKIFKFITSDELHSYREQYKVACKGSKRATDCQCIAGYIRPGIFNGYKFDPTKKPTTCILICLEAQTIKAMASIIKRSDYIEVQFLTGFDYCGTALLQHIIMESHKYPEYGHVKIGAASNDSKLTKYYQKVAREIGYQNIETEGSHIKIHLENFNINSQQ